MGENFSSWTETILMSIAALLVIIVIFGIMDLQYNQNISAGITGPQGIRDNSSSWNNSIGNISSLINQTQSGTPQFNTLGVSLTTSWSMVITVMTLIFNFLGGGFINTIISALNLGAAGAILSTVLTTIWFLGLIFFIIYLLFKVKS